MKPHFTKKEMINLSENISHTVNTISFNFATDSNILESKINKRILDISDTLGMLNKEGWNDLPLESKLKDLKEFKKILFCDISELPLFLNNNFDDIAKWRLKIGK